MSKILNTLKELDNWEQRYEYLIEQGRKLEPLNESEKTNKFLISSCISRAWIIPKMQNGKIILKAESKSQMVQGLLALLLDIFNNQTPKEILSFDTQQLKNAGIDEVLTPTRVNGFYSAIKYIQDYARSQIK